MNLHRSVRRLLLSLDLRAGEPMEAARRVGAIHGNSTGEFYLLVRQQLAELGEDIDQSPGPGERALLKGLRYAGRRGAGPARLAKLARGDDT